MASTLLSPLSDPRRKGVLFNDAVGHLDYIASVIDERNTSTENLWNFMDKGNRSTRAGTRSSATLSATNSTCAGWEVEGQCKGGS